MFSIAADLVKPLPEGGVVRMETMKKRTLKFGNVLILLLAWSAMLSAVSAPDGKTGKWKSTATQSAISYTVRQPAHPLKDPSGRYPTIVYLEHLSCKKVGQNSIEADVSWLLQQGYRVVELNYAQHEKAVAPYLNDDIIALNNALADDAFCGLTDCSQTQSFVLFEGYRIARDISYFVDDPTVYNYAPWYTVGDSLRMDVVYPANAAERIPVILSFSYSNSYPGAKSQNLRMFLLYTFAGFNDSFLEGAPAHGMAWAIADHPKYCPWGEGKPLNGPKDAYKSFMANPDVAQKVKSAVRSLRAKGANLGLSGSIGVYGFSRGSTAGAMAVGDKKVPLLEDAGFHQNTNDAVQAAALGPGEFDFTRIYAALNDGDQNLEQRCPWVWGPLEENYEKWFAMGAASLVHTKASAPVLFFYNTNDSPHYERQIRHFKQKLEELHIPVDSLVNYGHGHSIPQTHDALQYMYRFFIQYLSPSETSFQPYY